MTQLNANANSFSSTFVLDKAHYTECYTQSSTLSHDKKTYMKANILTVFGLFILFATPVNPYAAWFVIALGILETVSIYYHKPWWVMRQMLSKASHSEVKLTIDEQGILTESYNLDKRILWADVNLISKTDLGFLVHYSFGKGLSGKEIANKSYISKSCLSAEVIDFMAKKFPISN